jgi:hypothetical protein
VCRRESRRDAPVPVFDAKRLTEILGFADLHAFEQQRRPIGLASGPTR